MKNLKTNSILNWIAEIIAIALIIVSVYLAINIHFTYTIAKIAFIACLFIANMIIDFVIFSSLAIDEKYINNQSDN